jgi:peptidoglycan/LPS O-acetylase OafA/YrhL
LRDYGAMTAPKPHANPAGQGRLPLLDGMRGIAALGVFVFHIPMYFVVPPMLLRSYLLVDLFFLLSGFVLTFSAEPRLARGLDTVGFMKIRLRRIWPTMALGAILGAGIFAMQTSPQQSLMLLGMALLLIPITNGNQSIFPLNAPQWSLMWELAGNVLHGLVLWRLGERALLALALAGGAVVLWSTLMLDSGGSGGVTENWYWAAPRVVWSYVLGVWLARRWQRARLGGNPRPWLGWKTALLLPVAWLAVLQYLPLGQGIGDALTILVVLPLAFHAATTVRPPESAGPLLAALGGLSFPLYALHAPVFLAFKFQSKGAASCVAAVITALALSAFVAWQGPRFGKALFGGLARLRERLPALASAS